MPIRINLLAEAQALEAERRRDPVKRVILAGIVLIILILAWSSKLMLQTMIDKRDVTTLVGNLNSRTNEYRQILDNQKQLVEIKQKLGALHQLATNRFLVGNLLDALQKSTVDNAQLVRLKVDQTFSVTEEVKAQTGADAPPPKRATSTEKILLTLNAKDVGSPQGDAVNKYQISLSSLPYFREALGKTNGFRLAAYGTPQSDPDGKPYVLFTLEARFPEKTR